MIVSHKYKYLFIEIPLTASWAIRNELCEYYDGIPVLHKHATYSEFRRQGSKKEMSYFVFAAVRNPLDKIVSRYYKLKMNQKEIFSKDAFLRQSVIDYSDIKKYAYIISQEISFEEYFIKYCKKPYNDMVDFSSRYLNYVVRYESIQDGFSGLLKSMGVEQIRALPRNNRTPGKRRDYLANYTPLIIDQAKRVCGPFMKKWGYPFPDGWGENRLSMTSNLEYMALNSLKYLYALYFRYNQASYAVAIRKLMARLF